MKVAEITSVCDRSEFDTFYDNPLDAMIALEAQHLSELIEACNDAGHTVPLSVRRGAQDLYRWASHTLQPRGSRSESPLLRGPYKDQFIDGMTVEP
jgi:hypothetical protein